MMRVVRENPTGWTVVSVSFLVLALVFTARSTLGLLMPVWEAELGWSRAFTSTGGSVLLIVMALVAPFSGNLVDRLGPRAIFVGGLIVLTVAIFGMTIVTEGWQFILLFCVLGAVAYGAIAVPIVVTTTTLYFEERRGIAGGIASAGGSGGQFLLLPLAAVGVTAIGWRETYAVLGVLMALAALAAFVAIRKDRAVEGRAAAPPLFSRLDQLRRSGTFWLLLGGFVICGFTTIGVIEVHLLPYAASCGFPPVQSATAFGVMSAANMAGLILFGHLADRLHRPMLLAGIYFVRALTFVLLMAAANDITLLFVFGAIFGLVNFSTMPVIANIVATHIGVRMMGLTTGLLFAGHSLGGAIGAFTGGYIFDAFATYQWTWVASIALALLAAFFSLMIRETRTEGAVPVPA